MQRCRRRDRMSHQPIQTLLVPLFASKRRRKKTNGNNVISTKSGLPRISLVRNSDSLYSPIRGHIWDSPRHPGRIPDGSWERQTRFIRLEVGPNCYLLIRRDRKPIAEPTAAEDDLFARRLRLLHRRARVHLRGADRSDVRTCAGEGRVEDRARRGLGAYF
jgi:hypothetical protein